jgi:hypothetical protein
MSSALESTCAARGAGQPIRGRTPADCLVDLSPVSSPGCGWPRVSRYLLQLDGSSDAAACDAAIPPCGLVGERLALVPYAEQTADLRQRRPVHLPEGQHPPRQPALACAVIIDVTGLPQAVAQVLPQARRLRGCPTSCDVRDHPAERVDVLVPGPWCPLGPLFAQPLTRPHMQRHVASPWRRRLRTPRLTIEAFAILLGDEQPGAEPIGLGLGAERLAVVPPVDPPAHHPRLAALTAGREYGAKATTQPAAGASMTAPRWHTGCFVRRAARPRRPRRNGHLAARGSPRACPRARRPGHVSGRPLRQRPVSGTGIGTGADGRADRTIGWSHTTLPDDTGAGYRRELAAVTKALTASREPELGSRHGRTKNNRLSLVCACGRHPGVPRGPEQGPILCGLCGNPFGT